VPEIEFTINRTGRRGAGFDPRGAFVIVDKARDIELGREVVTLLTEQELYGESAP
jgi:hypothetical protein